MMPPVWDIVNRYLPRCKKATKGWLSFHAVCCHHRGHRMDSQGRGWRGGILYDGSQISYHCFNCSFKAYWRPGFVINGSFKKLLEYLGIANDEIKELNYKCWRYRQTNDDFEFIKPEEKLEITTPINLPSDAHSLSVWAEHGLEDPNYINVLEYLASRNIPDINPENFYWSPNNDMKRRLIIPMFWNHDIVGYQSRAIDDSPKIMKYIKKIPSNYIYNNTLLFDFKKTNLFLVEGIFDAIGLNCLSVLGNNISQDQAKYINSFNKDITIVPDLDKSGADLIAHALENDWYVSFPHEIWSVKSIESKSVHIKDAADAISCFGRLFTIWSIMKYRTNDRLEIQMCTKKYYGKTI